ncbi:hypothetical protein UY3_11673 [Chelonia mydas]|uniref:Uncharacterized protein n=1 Tax=Chelonia mydas TaxID=8469 RepID=M7BGD9_CHEMY|nr:hypothetical protein UY3_11673 [Chelonia mydas]
MSDALPHLIQYRCEELNMFVWSESIVKPGTVKDSKVCTQLRKIKATVVLADYVLLPYNSQENNKCPSKNKIPQGPLNSQFKGGSDNPYKDTHLFSPPIHTGPLAPSRELKYRGRLKSALLSIQWVFTRPAKSVPPASIAAVSISLVVETSPNGCRGEREIIQDQYTLAFRPPGSESAALASLPSIAFLVQMVCKVWSWMQISLKFGLFRP